MTTPTPQPEAPTPEKIDQRLVDHIIARAQNSMMGLGDSEGSYSLDNYANPTLESVAMLLVTAHTAKYDLISLFTAGMEEIAAQRDAARTQLKLAVKDWTEDDTAIKAFCAKFGINTVGDSFSVPSMVDCVEELANSHGLLIDERERFVAFCQSIKLASGEVGPIQVAKARIEEIVIERDAAQAELANATKERDSLADQLAESTRTVENYEALTKRYVAALEVEGSKLREAGLS